LVDPEAHHTEAQRAELVELVTTGQATIRGAAARRGVADSTAYYWITRTGQLRVRLARLAATATAGQAPTRADG
jgi:transposase-like protein